MSWTEFTLVSATSSGGLMTAVGGVAGAGTSTVNDDAWLAANNPLMSSCNLVCLKRYTGARIGAAVGDGGIPRRVRRIVYVAVTCVGDPLFTLRATG